jgi:hypothetical protein
VDRNLTDWNLQDDSLKLVRYKILFVKRDLEVAFPEREELVAENMTAEAFNAWKVAEFIQEMERGETPVPPQWARRKYPPRLVEDGKVKGLPDADKKYLRVYYDVLERYVREDDEAGETDVLRDIRDAVNGLGTKPGE